MEKKALVKFSGVIAIPTTEKQNYVSFKDPFTVKDLLNKLGYKEIHHKFIIVSIKSSKVTLETYIQDNDVIDLFLPTGGG